MLKNIWTTLLVNLWNKMESCVNPLVFTLLSRME